MKATKRYFPVVLFIMLYKVVLTLSLWKKSLSVTIQMKSTEQYFLVVLFIMLYMVVLTFESVNKIPMSDHSNESYWTVLSCSIVCYAVHCGSKLWVCKWILSVTFFKWNGLNSRFRSFPLFCKSVAEVLKGDHPNEKVLTLLFCGSVFVCFLWWFQFLSLWINSLRKLIQMKT